MLGLDNPSRMASLYTSVLLVQLQRRRRAGGAGAGTRGVAHVLVHDAEGRERLFSELVLGSFFFFFPTHLRDFTLDVPREGVRQLQV